LAILGVQGTTGVEDSIRYNEVLSIKKLVESHRSVPLTQAEFDEFNNKYKRKFYLHYS